ncbi:MAG: SUMF1/EgtB/PvdO family nonheme iron enzyme [Myxococcales bacterium]|nr:SUMF1/EgtB/PvdO family nonheme iron enzyme [Myxococcales bacterium]
MLGALSLLVILAAPAACDYAASHALVVGIDRYGPGISPLRAARRDAERVGAALRARGFQVSELLDGQATRANIMRTLGDELLPRTRPDDRVVIYFAGHGVTVGERDHTMGYLIPADGHPDRPVATGIAMRELTELLGTAPARHRLFLADACYSGLALPGERSLKRAALPPGDAARCAALREPVTSVIVAGRKGQVALEDADGGAFTHTLLRGLAGQADPDGDGTLSHLELAAYLDRVVPQFTLRRWGQVQSPQAVHRGAGTLLLAVVADDANSAIPTPVTPARQRTVRGVAVVEVPAGAFLMGCDPTHQPGCPQSEQPRRQVTLPAYGITRTEITAAQYGRCVEAGGCTPTEPQFDQAGCNGSRFDRGEHPMNCVTWAQAKAYCAWLGGGLCPATHWEKAARGGDGRRYPWGDESPTCARAQMKDSGDGCGSLDTAPVGAKPGDQSPFGVMDMAGNVTEFIADRIAEAQGQAMRVGYRGGAFSTGPEDMRCSAVGDQNPALTGTAFGIRCCLPPP